MHTKQGLSSERSNISVQGLLGCGGTWLFGFHMGGINISGRIKQSFYHRTRHGELKVISMIYAPPYLIRRSVPKVKSIDLELATSPMITPKHTRRQHWKASNGAPLLLRSITRSRRQHTTRQRDTDLSSRTVTNSLSGVSVTHDDTA